MTAPIAAVSSASGDFHDREGSFRNLRRRQYWWAPFIKAHLSAIASADFFTVEVLSWAGLVRYHVFFVMDLASRRVEIAGLSRCPDGLWMDQVARSLLEAGDALLLGKR
jgi:hypothetical protein